MKRNEVRFLFFLVALLTVCLAGAFVQYRTAIKHSFPEGDEGPWLRMAARAGTNNFLKSLVIEHDLYPQRTLPHPEDNRSPLYPLLLHIGNFFSADLFRGAQYVNILLFLICIVTTGYLLKNKIGALETILFCSIVGVSPIFIINTAHIYNDVVIAFSFFAALFGAISTPESRLRAIMSGFLCGLFFLMKLSAIFVIPLFLLPFLPHIKERETQLRLILFLAPCILLTLPWMLRNIHLFGSPFHQFTGYAMWTDSVKEVFGVNLPTAPSMKHYVATHGIFFTFIVRPAIGFQHLIGQLLTHDHYLTPALLVFVPFGIIRLRCHRSFWQNAVLFSLPYLFLMAHVAYGFWVDRYLLLYYLLIYLLAATGLIYLSNILAQFISARLLYHAPGQKIPRSNLLRFTFLCVFSLLPLSQVVRPLEYYISSRGSETLIDRDARILITALTPIVADNEAVFSTFVSGYSFLHDLRVVNAIEVGCADNFSQLQKSYNIRYAAIDTVRDEELLDSLHSWIVEQQVYPVLKQGNFAVFKW
jgi:hypothetical protein